MCLCSCNTSLQTMFANSGCVLSRRKTTVKMLCIYADYKSDESYTPSKISVRVGNNFHNLQEIRVSVPTETQSTYTGGSVMYCKYSMHAHSFWFEWSLCEIHNDANVYLYDIFNVALCWVCDDDLLISGMYIWVWFIHCSLEIFET